MTHERRSLVFLLPVLLYGCVSQVTTSSRSYLAPGESAALSAHDPRNTALEVTRLFEVRGINLVDQRVSEDSGTLQLKFASSQPALPVSYGAAGISSLKFGSVFYVWVRPSATGSRIDMLGKPTLDGSEPCSRDSAQLPCDGVSAGPGWEELSGRNEAQVIHGVLSELTLERYATRPPEVARPKSTPPEAAPSELAMECRARRHQVFLRAAPLADPSERAKLLKSAPECE